MLYEKANAFAGSNRREFQVRNYTNKILISLHNIKAVNESHFVNSGYFQLLYFKR